MKLIYLFVLSFSADAFFTESYVRMTGLCAVVERCAEPKGRLPSPPFAVTVPTTEYVA